MRRFTDFERERFHSVDIVSVLILSNTLRRDGFQHDQDFILPAIPVLLGTAPRPLERRYAMLFAWIGFLKPGAETISQEVNAETNEFLQQPYLHIHSVGPLCVDNRRGGMMMIFEAPDLAAAEALVA